MASACGGSLALMDAGTGEGMNDVFTVDNVCSKMVDIYYFYLTLMLQLQFGFQISQSNSQFYQGFKRTHTLKMRLY